ncbi:MAG: xanthine dehydrogenase family protein molybdopterin-binding subunit [Myxococcota bacterium]
MTTLDTPLSRRGFIKLVALTGGGFSLGFLVEGCAHLKGAQALGGAFHPNAWVRITPDNVITFFLDRAEMGQGILTSHVQLLCEELEVDPARVRVEFAPADREAFGIQLTGGSTSTTSQWDIIREAGATARELLKQAAARRWDVAISELRAENGVIIHPRAGRLTYGELASGAARETISEVKLKEPSAWKVIGQPQRRLDAPSKVNGTAEFSIDVRVPGMLYAVVLRPPALRGSLKGFDAEAAKRAPGVKAVMEIPHGVAVVADSTWRAKKAAALVQAAWNDGPMAGFSSEKLHAAHVDRVKKLGKNVTTEGDASAALAKASKRVKGFYQLPFLAHACMEPMNCTAHVQEGRCDLWLGTQSVSITQEVAARITGLPHAAIHVHNTLMGGGFGRRSTGDYVAEAVEISQRVKAPVKVTWSREDDMRHAQYRPAGVALVEGGVDEKGMPVAWHHRMVTQSIATAFMDLAGTFAPEWVPRPLLDFLQSGGKRFLEEAHLTDPIVTEGSSPPYALPNLKVEAAQQETGVPAFAWRSVGHSINAFVVESFLDELAHLGGQDPFELRRKLLANAPRHKAVLELCAEKIGWGTPPPAGRFRGIAQHSSFDSYCAHAVEISVDGGLRVHRVVSAVDVGHVVNPDLVAAQVESGIIFGLSAALKQRIELENGRVRQGNFHNFPLLRMHEAPQIETHIVSSREKPTGVGEIAVPPMAPALTNALFVATGHRFRRLPLEDDLALVLQGKKPEEVVL